MKYLYQSQKQSRDYVNKGVNSGVVKISIQGHEDVCLRNFRIKFSFKRNKKGERHLLP